MDISAIKPVERLIEIVHPADESRKLGIRVTLVSMNDERVKKVRRRIQDEKLKLDARGKNFKASDIEDNTNALLFNCMTGWEWYNPTGKTGDKGFSADAAPSFKGNEKPEFNRVTTDALFNELPWFADQLMVELAEEKEFFTNSKSA